MNRGGLILIFLLSTSSLVAFGQGCSSSSGSSAGGACASYISALRDGAKECGRLNISPSRESEYLARLQRSCESILSAPGSGIAPSLLEQCSSKLREQCGDDDACEDLFEDIRGSLGEGAACADDTQCASGQCRNESDTQAPSPCGKCVATKQIGEPCPDGGCVTGSSCRSTGTAGSEPTCVAVRIVNEGETCGTSSPNEVLRCATGLDCSSGGDTGASTGKCTAPVGEGATCGNGDSQFARCKAPFSCVNDRCARLSASGQPCANSNDCANGLGCDETGTCTAIVWGASGATCDDDLRRCDRGFCVRTTSSGGSNDTGTCVDYLADGAPCDPAKSLDQRCESPSRCVNGTCQLEDPSQCK